MPDLVDVYDLRVWLRLPVDDFDVDAAVLHVESAESAVRSVVGDALDVLRANSEDPTGTRLWREARAVALEHAALTYPNPEGVLQRRIDGVGSTSFADSRHSTRDLTRGQRARLKAAVRATGLQSVRLT